MSSILFSLPEIYNSYKAWVSKNPQVLTDYESYAKWISYFIAGRINNSHAVSELVYSLSNLLVLFNDRIIRKTHRLQAPNSGDKLKLWLTVVEYSEVFCELSAKKLWGSTGRWIIIIAIQVFKCAARLILIYHHKEGIIQNPPIQLLDRKNLSKDSNLNNVEIDLAKTQMESTFTLKRSGRVIRKVDSSPPVYARTWKPIEKTSVSFETLGENQQIIEQALAGRQLVSETIYVAKPIIHLISVGCFGSQTWKPWVISLVMDLSSLHLYKSCKNKKTDYLTTKQKLQLSRRTVALLLYLIRSPFYEKQSKDRIQALLVALSNHVPLAKIICNPALQYLPFWQSNYFYMWST